MTLPTWLSLLRILLIPPICVLISLDGPAAAWWALGLYVFACLTDYFDGVIARRFDMVSDLGRMADHIADKLLVASVIVMLVADGRIAGWTLAAAILLICRELLISGMREHLGGRAVVLKVSWTAKWKTTVQMLALGFLILGDALVLPPPLTLIDIGTVGLWLAAVLSVVSGYGYVRAGMDALANAEADRAGVGPGTA